MDSEGWRWGETSRNPSSAGGERESFGRRREEEEKGKKDETRRGQDETVAVNLRETRYGQDGTLPARVISFPACPVGLIWLGLAHRASPGDGFAMMAENSENSGPGGVHWAPIGLPLGIMPRSRCLSCSATANRRC